MILYLLVLLTILVAVQYRKTNNAKWRYVASRERSKLRRELRHGWAAAAHLAHTRDIERLLIVYTAPQVKDTSGYITIEIPELVKWLVMGNEGAKELLERAISAMAVQKLQELLA